MNLETLDLAVSSYLGILAAAVAYFVLGGLWYAFLFSNRWLAATGRTVEELGAGAGAKMAITFVAGIVSAAVIAIVYEWAGAANILDGLAVGAILGVGVAAMEALKDVVYHYDERSDPWTLYAIGTSYTVLGFLVMGGLYALIA